MALFEPYRCIGLVCDEVAPAVNQLGKETFLTVSIGKAFQVFKADKLGLSIVSQQIDRKIICTVCWKHLTFTGVGRDIVVWQRTKPVGVLSGHKGPVVTMLVVGQFLLSLSSDSTIKVWSFTPSGEATLMHSVHLPFDQQVTGMMHPNTYINKVVVSTEQGSLFIVNIRTKKIVFHSTAFEGKHIRQVVQSPVVDVVAVACADGSVTLHNLKADKAITAFTHENADSTLAVSPVTCVAFCSCPSRPAQLATATAAGHIFLWDLKEKRLIHSVRHAHNGAVTGLVFLPREPRFVSFGTDNAVRQWVLNEVDGIPKQIRSRTGHTAPPRQIQYFFGDTVNSMASGADAAICEVLSAGQDQALRVFHTVLDRQNRELSQGHLEKKARELGVAVDDLRLPMITDMACSDRRHSHWPDVITAHAGDNKAYTWFYENKAIGDVVLACEDPSETVTAVAISACGHFGIIGGSRGTVTKFNLQSGLTRGTFPKLKRGAGFSLDVKKNASRRSKLTATPLPAPNRDIGTTRAQTLPPGHIMHGIMGLTANVNANDVLKKLQEDEEEGKAVDVSEFEHETATAAGADGQFREIIKRPASKAHAGAVYGIAVDALNAVVVTVGADNVMRMWSMFDHKLEAELVLDATPNRMVFNKESNLAAVSCDDLSVLMVDIGTKKIVRRFTAHTNKVTDMAFSPDGRWLLTSSLDCSVRVWDLPTARCLSWLKFATPVTSLAMSPTSEYLITAHAGSKALFMWANAHFFSSVHFDKVPTSPTLLSLPAPTADGEGVKGGSELISVAADGKRKRGVTSVDADSDDDSADEDDLPVAAAAKRQAVQDAETGSVNSEEQAAAEADAEWVEQREQQERENLHVLDLIAERNKPKEAPKQPEQAPFFLPTVAGIKPKFMEASVPEPSSTSTKPSAAKPSADNVDDPFAGGDEWASAWNDADSTPLATNTKDFGKDERNVDSEARTSAGSRLLRTVASGLRRSRSKLSDLLVELCRAQDLEQDTDVRMEVGGADSDDDEDAEPYTISAAEAHVLDSIAQYLTSLGPSAIDAAFQSLCLSADDTEGLELLSMALDYFAWAIAARRRFELTQGQLRLFMKIYSEELATDAALKPKLRNVLERQKATWGKLQSLMQHTLCLVNYFASVQQY